MSFSLLMGGMAEVKYFEENGRVARAVRIVLRRAWPLGSPQRQRLEDAVGFQGLAELIAELTQVVQAHLIKIDPEGTKPVDSIDGFVRKNAEYAIRDFVRKHSEIERLRYRIYDGFKRTIKESFSRWQDCGSHRFEKIPDQTEITARQLIWSPGGAAPRSIANREGRDALFEGESSALPVPGEAKSRQKRRSKSLKQRFKEVVRELVSGIGADSTASDSLEPRISLSTSQRRAVVEQVLETCSGAVPWGWLSDVLVNHYERSFASMHRLSEPSGTQELVFPDEADQLVLEEAHRRVIGDLNQLDQGEEIARLESAVALARSYQPQVKKAGHQMLCFQIWDGHPLKEPTCVYGIKDYQDRFLVSKTMAYKNQGRLIGLIRACLEERVIEPGEMMMLFDWFRRGLYADRCPPFVQPTMVETELS